MNTEPKTTTIHKKNYVLLALLGISLSFFAAIAGNLLSPMILEIALPRVNIFVLFLLCISGAMVSGIIFLKPKIGILGLLIVVAIMPPVPRQIGIVEILFVGLYVLVMSSWILKTIFTGKDLLFNSLILKILSVFILICFLSIFKSLLNNISMESWGRGFFPFLMLLLSFSIAREFKSTKDTWLLLSAFILSNLLYSLQTWLPLFLNFPSLFSSNPISTIRSTLPPYAWQNLPLAGFALLIGLSKYLPKGRLRLFLKLLAIFFGLTVLITFSRSMISAMIVTLLFSFVISINWRNLSKRFVQALIILVILILFSLIIIRFTPLSPLFTDFLSRFTFLTTNEATPVIVRLIDYNVALKNFLAQPIFGWGLGATFEFYRIGFGIYREVAYTHNLFTYLLLYLGLVGFMCFVYLLYTLFRGLFALRMNNDLHIRAVTEGLLLSVVSVLFYAQFQTSYKSFTFNIFLAIVIGLFARMKASQHEIRSDKTEEKEFYE